MLLNVALFVLGAASLQQQAELPSVLWTYALVVPATLGWWLLPQVGRWQTIARRIAGAALCCAAGFLWAALVAHVKLADHLAPEWEGRDIVVRGAIAELPQATDRGMRFGFDVEQTVTPLAHVPRHITLTWYAEKEADAQADPQPLHPGQRWQLIVRLRRPHALANPHGFDFDAWLLERGIRATGYIRADRSNRMLELMLWRAGYVVERAREWVRDRIVSYPPCLTIQPQAYSLRSPSATSRASLAGKAQIRAELVLRPNTLIAGRTSVWCRGRMTNNF